MHANQTIAILGGTGQEGGGLAVRWANAGYAVILGSRDPARAEAAADKIKFVVAKANVRGAGNLDAAAAADVIVLTVPFAAQRPIVEEVRSALAGKILVDATVPVVPPKVARVQLPAGGSAVAAIQAMLGESVRVVSAFQNVSAHALKELERDVDCDVLVCGDNVEARETVIRLAAAIGLRGIHAGPIVNSAAAEALTSILIAINRRYKIPGAGIRITGLPHDLA
jgi:NADPH-dependent F420 reductase